MKGLDEASHLLWAELLEEAFLCQLRMSRKVYISPLAFETVSAAFATNSTSLRHSWPAYLTCTGSKVFKNSKAFDQSLPPGRMSSGKVSFVLLWAARMHEWSIKR